MTLAILALAALLPLTGASASENPLCNAFAEWKFDYKKLEHKHDQLRGALKREAGRMADMANHQQKEMEGWVNQSILTRVSSYLSLCGTGDNACGDSQGCVAEARDLATRFAGMLRFAQSKSKPAGDRCDKDLNSSCVDRMSEARISERVQALEFYQEMKTKVARMPSCLNDTVGKNMKPRYQELARMIPIEVQRVGSIMEKSWCERDRCVRTDSWDPFKKALDEYHESSQRALGYLAQHGTSKAQRQAQKIKDAVASVVQAMDAAAAVEDLAGAETANWISFIRHVRNADKGADDVIKRFGEADAKEFCKRVTRRSSPPAPPAPPSPQPPPATTPPPPPPGDGRLDQAGDQFE